MSTQIVAGLMMAFRKVMNITFEGGLVIGLPLIWDYYLFSTGSKLLCSC